MCAPSANSLYGLPRQKQPLRRQQRLKALARPAGAGIFAAEFLVELFVSVNYADAALDAGLRRIPATSFATGLKSRAVRPGGGVGSCCACCTSRWDLLGRSTGGAGHLLAIRLIHPVVHSSTNSILIDRPLVIEGIISTAKTVASLPPIPMATVAIMTPR